MKQLQVKRLLVLAEPPANKPGPSHILIKKKKSAEINQISEELTESDSQAHLHFYL